MIKLATRCIAAGFMALLASHAHGESRVGAADAAYPPDACASARQVSPDERVTSDGGCRCRKDGERSVDNLTPWRCEVPLQVQSAVGASKRAQVATGTGTTRSAACPNAPSAPYPQHAWKKTSDSGCRCPAQYKDRLGRSVRYCEWVSHFQRND